MTILLAILLGAFFGFALHRAAVTNSENILEMLTLRDFYLMKVTLFAIGLTTTLIWISVPAGIIDPGHFSVKATHFGVLIGGLIFGVGFALAGYCPGTAIAAVGQGRRDALWFVAGGLLGALVFTLAFDFVGTTGVFDAWALGKVTLGATGSEKFASVGGAWLMLLSGGLLLAGSLLIPTRRR